MKKKSSMDFFLTKLFTSEIKANEVNHFILHSRGNVSFDENNEWQLLSTSRIGLLGAWLHLKKINNGALVSERKVLKQFFIFKDSVSHEDFSRLSRVIYFTKSQSH